VAPYAAKFSQPLATARGRQTARRGCYVLARGVDSHGNACSGLGEAAPLPAWGTEGHLEAAQALGALPPLSVHTPGEIAGVLFAAGLVLGEHPAAFAAAELALLDLLARAEGVSVATLIADGYTPTESVKVNALIGALPVAAAATRARQLAGQGYTVFKLKLAGDAPGDLARVAAVREAIGPAAVLRLDANGSWSTSDALARLVDFAPYDVAYVEQPTAPADFAALAVLAREGAVPVAADESVHLPGGLDAAILAGVAALVLKPMALGGLLATRDVLFKAKAAGIACVLSSAIDRGVATAGILHLCAATPGLPAAGLATASLFVDGGALAGLEPVDGAIRLAGGPGLGFAPLDPVLLELTAV
jgi:o-succinylbenzoate synthase